MQGEGRLHEQQTVTRGRLQEARIDGVTRFTELVVSVKHTHRRISPTLTDVEVEDTLLQLNGKCSVPNHW